MYRFIDLPDCDSLRLAVDFMLIEEMNAETFGLLELNGLKLGISWNGKLKPKIDFAQNSELLLIGVGSTVCIISTKLNQIKFMMGLHNPFSFFLTHKDKVLVLSETTFTKINLNIFCIELFTGIPDIILDGRVVNDTLIIRCLDEEFTFNNI